MVCAMWRYNNLSRIDRDDDFEHMGYDLGKLICVLLFFLPLWPLWLFIYWVGRIYQEFKNRHGI